MIPSKRTHGMVLGAAAILAVAVPSIAHWVLSARIDDRLEPALAEALGTGVSIGSIEASLTGSVRVQDVRIDRVLEIDSIEAAVGLGRLLRGDLRAEELRVVSPRVRVHVDAQGRSNLERLARRWAERKGGNGVARQARRDHGIRRIVVTEGDLVVHLGGHGEMRLRGVALQPRAGGVRMTVAGAELELGADPYALRGGFDRMAGDLVVPAMRFDRLVAAGGDLTLHTRGATPVRFQRAMLLRDGTGGGDRFAAAVERSGSSGRLVVTAPHGARARLFEIQAQDVPLGPLGPLLPTGFELGAASGSGRAVVRRADGETELGLEASLARVAVDDARVARRRVETDLEVKARVRRRGSELEILSFEARRGALDLALTGRLGLAAGVPERGTVELRLA
ncbi:MAG TPA: hypothetical protein VML75_15915, partial [Kofleriaceae bacterium]|nr:hypothetical protein [Kofleriaceae bacterium]